MFFCFLTVLLCGAGTGDIWAGTWTSGSTTVTTSGSTVTVSGNGPMADYNYEFDAPWLTDAITSIVIEDGVTHIGAYAFIRDYLHPSKVTSVTIPVSVATIGEGAFASNLKMENIRYAGSPNEWASIEFANEASNPFGDSDASPRNFYFHGCDFTTTTLTLAPGLTQVNDYAFYKMSLANVNIPGSVTHIGRWAFKCSISSTVCVNRATPPTTGYQAFSYNPSAKLYVPSGSETTYTSAGTPWYRSSYGASDGASSIIGQAVSGTLSAAYGEGVTWALDEDGILTFDASDPSASKSITLAAGGSYPWGNFRRLVDKVRLRGEITDLGNALAYHWFLRGVILDQNTVPACSNNIGSSSITSTGTTAYNSIFNPCHPLTLNVKLSSLITPSEADKLESAPWNDGHWETVIDEEVVIDENSADNMALLAAVRTYIDRPFTMRLQRSVSNAYYNTFCPPADLSAEQVESVFGTGSEIHALTGSSYDASANELTLNFADAQDYMEAGVPYLFRPANNVSNPVFTDVAPSSTAASEGSVNAPHVVFRGTLEPRDVTTAEISAKNFIFLQAENHLNWASSGTLKGMRAYWLLKEGVPAHALARRPVMRIGNAATGTESIQPSEVRSQKILHNGQLYLMYEGRMYDVQGRRIQ